MREPPRKVAQRDPAVAVRIRYEGARGRQNGLGGIRHRLGLEGGQHPGAHSLSGQFEGRNAVLTNTARPPRRSRPRTGFAGEAPYNARLSRLPLVPRYVAQGTASKHRDHRARGSRQDHARGQAAAASRLARRAPRDPRARDGLERPRARARHHDPREEHGDQLAATGASTSSTRRATRTSAARWSACCRWSTACCCSSTRSTARCRRRASSRSKAFCTGFTPLVVINKIDRDGARPHWVLDQTFELFDRLGASDKQLDFPVIYASALQGLRAARCPTYATATCSRCSKRSSSTCRRRPSSSTDRCSCRCRASTTTPTSGCSASAASAAAS